MDAHVLRLPESGGLHCRQRQQGGKINPVFPFYKAQHPCRRCGQKGHGAKGVDQIPDLSQQRRVIRAVHLPVVRHQGPEQERPEIDQQRPNADAPDHAEVLYHTQKRAPVPLLPEQGRRLYHQRRHVADDKINHIPPGNPRNQKDCRYSDILCQRGLSEVEVDEQVHRDGDRQKDRHVDVSLIHRIIVRGEDRSQRHCGGEGPARFSPSAGGQLLHAQRLDQNRRHQKHHMVDQHIRGELAAEYLQRQRHHRRQEIVIVIPIHRRKKRNQRVQNVMAEQIVHPLDGHAPILAIVPIVDKLVPAHPIDRQARAQYQRQRGGRPLPGRKLPMQLLGLSNDAALVQHAGADSIIAYQKYQSAHFSTLIPL